MNLVNEAKKKYREILLRRQENITDDEINRSMYMRKKEKQLDYELEARKYSAKVEKKEREVRMLREQSAKNNPSAFQKFRQSAQATIGKVISEAKANRQKMQGEKNKPSMFDSPGINFGGGSGADAFGLGQSPFSSNAKKTKK